MGDEHPEKNTEDAPRGEHAESHGLCREVLSALDRVDDAVFVLDADFHVTYANEATHSTFRPLGYSESLVGTVLWEVSHRAVESNLATAVARAFETQQQVQFREQSEPLDSWFETRIYPSDDGVTVYVSDVTDEVRRREYLERYETVIETMLDGVYVLDDRYEFVLVNEAYADMVGCEPDTLLGEHVSAVVTDETITTAVRVRGELERGEREILETELVRQDGATIPVECVFTPYPLDGDWRGTVCVVRNLSERNRLEAEKLAAEWDHTETFERLSHALDGTDTGIWDWDIETDEVVWLGPMSRLFGLGPDEFDGTYEGFFERVHPDDQPAVERAIQATLDGSEPYLVEHRIQLPTGETRWLEGRGEVYEDDDGTPVRLTGVATDITHRKRRERELHEANTRLNLALDGTDTGIWDWDIETDEVVWWGPTSRLFGLRPDEFEGTYEGVIKRVHPDDVADLTRSLKLVLEESKPYSGEFRILLPDGGIRWIGSRGELYDDGSNPIRMVGVATDITEQKQLEQELRASEELHRTTLSNITDTVFITDDSGTFTYVCPNVNFIFGESPDDVLALGSVGQLLDGDPAPDEFGDGDVVENIKRVVTDADGTEYTVLVTVTSVSIQGGTRLYSVRDITELEERGQALRDKETQLQTVVENAPLIHFMFDAEGTFTLSEGRGLEKLGFQPGEVVGESVFDLYSSSPDVIDVVDRALAGERIQTIIDFEDSTFEVWYEPVYGDDGAVESVIGVATDITELRRKELTLTALHRTSRELLTAETETDVADVVVDAGIDVLGLSSVSVLLFDERAGVLHPVAVAGVNGGATKRRSYGPESAYWEQFVGESVDATGTDEGEISVLLGSHGLFVAETRDGQSVTDDMVELAELLGSTAEETFDRVAREEALRNRERSLREQTVRLERLHEINEQIRNVEHVLVMSETRRDIERGVCERLAEPERVAFAWIGDVEDATVTPKSWAGSERGYLPALRDLDDTTEPSSVAASTLEPVVVQSVADRLREEPWRREALASGYQSVMSVPLVYDGHSYGVLTLYATHNDAFGRLMQSVLGELSETIAYAINAVETKRGFLTDRVVELVLRTSDLRDPLARLAEQTGSTIRFEGIVPGPEHKRIFFTVSGADASEIVAAADGSPALESIHVVSKDDDGGTFELTSASSLLANALVDHGAIPKRIESTDGETTAVVELSHGADVGSFVSALRRRFSDVELIARRDRDRIPLTRETFKTNFEAAVTARQLEVLRTAYFCGYFDSPRSMTGQEVASLLSITQPTFNYHLRAGQRTLLGMLVDERGDDSRY
ncbi:PAS domain S-box protein [Haloferax sp. YSMS24]|uniref:PAS domain S-box protein n=1 Tax=Haloferax sp. YSMS24 TaxID=3388425 RepID=UPI00398CCC76